MVFCVADMVVANVVCGRYRRFPHYVTATNSSWSLLTFTQHNNDNMRRQLILLAQLSLAVVNRNSYIIMLKLPCSTYYCLIIFLCLFNNIFKGIDPYVTHWGSITTSALYSSLSVFSLPFSYTFSLPLHRAKEVKRYRRRENCTQSHPVKM